MTLSKNKRITKNVMWTNPFDSEGWAYVITDEMNNAIGYSYSRYWTEATILGFL